MRRIIRFVAVAAVSAVLACGGDDDSQVADSDDSIADEVVTGFTTEQSDSGRVQWRLRAPRASRFGPQSVFVMESPKIEFYDEFGMLQTTLTSDSGKYFEKVGDMLAYGDVVAVSVDGDKLETDSLRYLNVEDRIVSDSFVKLTRGNDIITGYGLECDHNLSSVNVKRNVEASIVDDEGNFEGNIDG